MKDISISFTRFLQRILTRLDVPLTNPPILTIEINDQLLPLSYINIFALNTPRLYIIYKRYIYLFYALFIAYFNAFRRPLDEFAYINNRGKRSIIIIVNR